MFTKFRTGPAVASLAAASLFVIFRLVYKVSFGGVVIGDRFLPSLPAIQLPSPFSHISLFGEVTIDGLVATVVSALPFALLIVAFGLFASCLDVAKLIKLLTLKRSPAILRAFAIALAVLPKILLQTRQLLATSKLRIGLRPQHLLVPILGSAIDRALSLASNLELLHGKTNIQSGALQVIGKDLKVDGISLGNFEFKGHGITFITGPNGSGKTTLLRAIAELAASDGRKLSGNLQVFTPRNSGQIGYLPQDPRLGFLGESVFDEIELAEINLLQRNWNPKQSLSTLSEGQAKLFALDLILAKDPQILLLDEPFDGLDSNERGKLESVLEAISKKSLVLVTAPSLQLKSTTANQVWQITSDGLRPGEYQFKSIQKTGAYPPPGSALALSRSDLSATAAGRKLFENQSLELNEGGIYSLEGKNGVGKSSLLRLLASQDSRLVPENFQDLFVTDSLEEEFRLSDRLSKSVAGLSKATFFSILNGAENQNVEVLLKTHPRDLSFATSLALGIAIQVVQKPKVLLIDEPGKGFDPSAKEAAIEALKCVAETGTAVLFATHDSQFITAAHTRLRIQNQLIQEVQRESVES